MLTIGLVARDERAAEVALAHDEILGRGRRGGVGRARGFVGRKTALYDNGRVAVGDDVHVVAEVAQGGLQIVPGHVERDDIGRGFAGFLVQRGFERVDQGLERGHCHGRGGEGGHVRGCVVVDFLGGRKQVRPGVTAEVDDCFSHNERSGQGFGGWWL